MKQYQTTAGGSFQIGNMCIPADPANADYQRMLAEFAPHDEIIMKQIPGKDAAAAETARRAIRAKYDAMQTAIDLATTVEDIKAAAAEVLR